MINTINSIRTSPSHNGRYHRSDRKEVLEYLQESPNLTMTQVANQFNLSPSTVHHWVHRYLSKAQAQSIVQRGHNIRGEQISKRTKFRARKQQERIDSFKALKVSPKVKPQEQRELIAILSHLESEMGKVKKILKGYTK